MEKLKNYHCFIVLHCGSCGLLSSTIPPLLPYILYKKFPFLPFSAIFSIQFTILPCAELYLLIQSSFCFSHRSNFHIYLKIPISNYEFQLGKNGKLTMFSHVEGS